MKKLYEEASVQDIADAIREKTGGAETYRIAQMGAAVRSIPDGDQIAHADIPDYVKDGVLTLAQKVQAVKTASSIVFVTVADAHHATDESTGWKANIDTGNMDACRAIKALSHVTPLDFAAFLGDLTFGYKTTTAAQFEAQCKEFHRWLEEGLRGIPQLWTPGNHDTGEYFAAETGSLANLYGAALIRKYFSDYNAGAVYGSAEAGYCYRDLPGKKLRIINLNTVEGEITGGETAANALSEAQLLWFAQTLADLGSKADSAAWGFVILGHYPLDWGSARAGGKVLKAYLDGGSVTIGGKTVSFAGKNGAVCYGNFHGHLHNFKTSRIYVVPDNVSQSDPPTLPMAALRICCPSANYYRTNEVGDNNRLDSNQIEFGEETTHSKAPGATDTAFTVNVINPAGKKIYSFCYGAGYDRTLSFDFTVVMRTVKTTLTGCTGSNAAAAVEDGAAYTTTLTPKNGYTFDTVTVSMGGTDITATAYNAATGVVSIARVTGDITITATASKPVTYTNLVPTAVDSSGASMPYQNGYNLSSSGNAQSGSGFVTSGFIPLPGTVTSIGHNAFTGCKALKDVRCYGAPPTVQPGGAAEHSFEPGIVTIHYNPDPVYGWTLDTDGTWQGYKVSSKGACLHTGYGTTENTVPATCGADGHIDTVCANCGDVIATEVIPATGAHTWDNGTVTTEPTETTPGVRTFTCAVCSQTKTEVIPATGPHTHVWDEGTVTVAPTETPPGVRTYTCTVCGQTRTEIIPATGSAVCPGGAACPSFRFRDVPAPSNWAHEGIDYCVRHGLMSGFDATTFSPDTVSTRAQIVMILYNLSGDTTDYSKYYVPFTDVMPGTWYYNAVAWGYDKDIVSGMSATTFAPDGLITREQMAVLLYGYTEKYAPAYLGGAASLNGFPDAASVSNWAYAAMSWAVGNGLISGIASNGADYLAPSGGATRAQIAAIMMRYCRLTGL